MVVVHACPWKASFFLPLSIRDNVILSSSPPSIPLSYLENVSVFDTPPPSTFLVAWRRGQVTCPPHSHPQTHASRQTKKHQVSKKLKSLSLSCHWLDKKKMNPCSRRMNQRTWFELNVEAPRVCVSKAQMHLHTHIHTDRLLDGPPPPPPFINIYIRDLACSLAHISLSISLVCPFLHVEWDAEALQIRQAKKNPWEKIFDQSIEWIKFPKKQIKSKELP